MSERKCGDCGVAEGELHQRGCDMERCPFCGHQLIGCDCCYEQLGLVDMEQYPETDGLPHKIFNEGLNEEDGARWEKILENKGRVPWISYPNFCRMCGELWPKMFMVPNEEWEEYIPINERRYMLCRRCYDEIKRKIDAGRK